MREISGEDIRSLKTASRQLVREIGGVEAAATVSRYGRSALAEAYDPHSERTLPADVVADLERCAGRPLVTAVLARLAGHVLVPVVAGGGREAQAIAEVLGGAGEIGRAFAGAMADARLTDAERAMLTDRLVALQAACMQAVAALMRERTGRG